MKRDKWREIERERARGWGDARCSHSQHTAHGSMHQSSSCPLAILPQHLEPSPCPPPAAATPVQRLSPSFHSAVSLSAQLPQPQGTTPAHTATHSARSPMVASPSFHSTFRRSPSATEPLWTRPVTIFPRKGCRSVITTRKEKGSVGGKKEREQHEGHSSGCMVRAGRGAAQRRAGGAAGRVWRLDGGIKP